MEIAPSSTVVRRSEQGRRSLIQAEPKEVAPEEEALELAERAHASVQVQPRRALAMAEEALRLARVRNDYEAQVAALHALGFARYVLGDNRALPTVRAAVRVGERRGYHHRAAMARRHVALYSAYAGKPAAALREIEIATAALTGIDRARTAVFKIAVFGLAGRPEAGLAGSNE